MELSVEGKPGKTTLRICGPVRLGEVAALHEQVTALSELGGAVEIDLGEVEHVHAAAWQVLLAFSRELAARGQQLRAIRVGEPTRSVMVELLNLQSWIAHQEDAD